MTTYLQHKDLANTRISDARAQQIRDGLHRTLDRLHEAEQKAGRPEGSVRLLAATKTRDAGEIAAALAAGITVIGENRPQEVQIKAPVLQDLVKTDPNLHWPVLHLIGQLQKNKINKVLPHVTTIESVESAEEAQNIATRVPGKAPPGRSGFSSRSTSRARPPNPAAIRNLPTMWRYTLQRSRTSLGRSSSRAS